MKNKRYTRACVCVRVIMQHAAMRTVQEKKMLKIRLIRIFGTITSCKQPINEQSLA